MKKLIALIFVFATLAGAQDFGHGNLWKVRADTLRPAADRKVKLSGLRVLGDVKVEGTLNMRTVSNSAIKNVDGTAAKPAYTFLVDSTTGMYRNTTTGALSFSERGTLQLALTKGGKLALSDATTDTTAELNVDREKTANNLLYLLNDVIGADSTFYVTSTAKTVTSDTMVSLQGIRTEGPALIKLHAIILDSVRVEESALFKQKAVILDSLRVEESALLKQKAVILDSLRVEETALIKGATTVDDKLVVNDSLRVEETALIKGATTIDDKLVVNDSLRVEETALIKGTLTTVAGVDIGGKLVVNDSLRVEETSLLKGAVTANTKLVVNDSLRVEETSLLKGTVTTVADVAIGTKAVINDSLRVEETSLLKGTVTTVADVAIGTKAVIGDSLRVEESALFKQKAVVNDSLRVEETAIIKGLLTTSDGITSTGTITSYGNINPGSADNYSLGAAAAFNSAYVSDNLCVGGKAQTASIYASQEATFANTDSSIRIYVNAGVPTISGAATDGDLSNITWNTADQIVVTGAGGGFVLASGTPSLVGAVQWDVSASDSINGASIAARTITDLALPSLAGDVTGTLGATVVGDDSHDHATTITGKAANVSDADLGDVTITGGAWGVEDDSHNHTTLSSGLVVGTTSADSMSFASGVLVINNDGGAANDPIATFRVTAGEKWEVDIDGDVTQAGQLTMTDSLVIRDATLADSIRIHDTGSAAIIKADNPISFVVNGTTSSAYVDFYNNSNSGHMAVGRTDGTEASSVAITDGGGDNLPGYLSMYEDDGNGTYLWVNTASTLRGRNAAFADDDADGYAIMDLSNGTIGSATQAVNGNTVVVYDSLRVEETFRAKGITTLGATGTVTTIGTDGKLTIGGSNAGVSQIDTVFTAGYVPRWLKITSGAAVWFAPLYAATDTTGKW